LEEADQLADKIALIDHGNIIAEGTAEQLKQQVGRERVELTFSHDQHFQQAHRILERQIVHSDEQKNMISIMVDGSPKQLKSVLDQMEQAAIEVEAVSLRKPTLDDVFLTITGRQALEVEGERYDV
jgi:ABC-2 type transport system ATP-binding protein